MIFFIFVCFWSCGTAQDPTSAYVVVHGSNNQFCLNSTRAIVSIHGVIADVKLVQLYQNLGGQSVDVDYIFPVTPEATVYAMQIVHQGNLILGQLKTTEAALKETQEAIDTGNLSVLLQEIQENYLQMSVSNILPNGILRTEVYYTLTLVPELGVYQFYFPSVVGPQYSEPSGSPDLSLLQPTFSISINLYLPFPVQSINSPTHPSMVITINGNFANASFSSDGDTQDMILQYSMSDDQILAGVITYQPSLDDNDNLPYYVDDSGAVVTLPMGSNNYFLAIIQTPSPSYITPFIVPREYIFVLDTSASMAGIPTKVLRELTTQIIQQLRPSSDYFNVIAFSGGTEVYSEESVLVSNESLSLGIDFVYSIKSQGTTLLLEALKKAVSIPSVVGRSRIICVLTDGLVFVEDEIFSFIQNNSGNSNFYAFAIGSIPNRKLTQGIAIVGRGKEFWAQTTQDATIIGSEFITHILSPVLTNVSLQFSDSFSVILDTVLPSQFGDVMGDRPLVVSGQFNGTFFSNDTLFTVSGLTAEGRTWTSNVSAPILEEVNQLYSHSLLYLWAKTMIEDITYTEPLDSTSMITDIALKYHILSAYTSFVAINTGQINDEYITNIDIPVCPTQCPTICACASYTYLNCPTIQCDLNCSHCIHHNPSVFAFLPKKSLTCKCPTTQYACDMYQCPSGIWIQCGNCSVEAPDLAPQPDSQQDSLSSNQTYQVPSGINTTQACTGIFSGSNGGFICDNQNYIYLETANLTLMDDTQIYLDGSLACEGNFSVTAPLTLTMTSLITVSSTIYIDNNLIIDMTNQSLPTEPIKIIDVPTTYGQFKSVKLVGIDSTCLIVKLTYEVELGVLFSLEQSCENSSGSDWILIVAVCVSSISVILVGVAGFVIFRYFRILRKRQLDKLKKRTLGAQDISEK